MAINPYAMSMLWMRADIGYPWGQTAPHNIRGYNYEGFIVVAKTTPQTSRFFEDPSSAALRLDLDIMEENWGSYVIFFSVTHTANPANHHKHLNMWIVNNITRNIYIFSPFSTSIEPASMHSIGPHGIELIYRLSDRNYRLHYTVWKVPGELEDYDDDPTALIRNLARLTLQGTIPWELLIEDAINISVEFDFDDPPIFSDQLTSGGESDGDPDSDSSASSSSSSSSAPAPAPSHKRGASPASGTIQPATKRGRD